MVKRHNIICDICKESDIISHTTLYRQRKKYGINICSKCSKNKISQSSKELWTNTEYRSRITEAGKQRDRVILSETAKKIWQDPGYRAKMEIIYASEEYRTKMSKNWEKPGFLEKYNLGIEEFIYRANKIHNNKYTYESTKYVSALTPVIITCSTHGHFSQTPHAHLYGEHGCRKCACSIISKPQTELEEFIRKLYNGVILSNNRDIIPPYELDIYLPELRLAIEHHGVYWHSYKCNESDKQRMYHSNKASIASNNNIRLLQIFESEWLYRRQIIESIITHIIGLSDRIYARNCKIIKHFDYKKFMDENHLQYSRSASNKYGLEYNGNLVAALGISKHSKFEFEIIRYANILSSTVVGGFSKLLKAASLDLNFNMIMTYADRRYSIGSVYNVVGFKKIGITKPNYYYVKGDQIYNRQSFQKHKLCRKLVVFDSNLSESENMFNNGYRRIWDAGHIKFLRRN